MVLETGAFVVKRAAIAAAETRQVRRVWQGKVLSGALLCGYVSLSVFRLYRFYQA
ncbi:MAG: hypothetical protein ACPG7F_19105 [Aggregatilineales bacterium]